MDRITVIRERLEKSFLPDKLDVIDDSDQHIGHAGSSEGAGHYTVIVRAKCFDNLTLIVSHRMIYDVLNDLIPKEIHALKIKIEKH